MKEFSLQSVVIEILATSSSPLTARRILGKLHERGHSELTRRSVNQELYSLEVKRLACGIEIPGESAPGWILSDSAKEKAGQSSSLSCKPKPAQRSIVASRSPISDRFKLLRWQKEALLSWSEHGYRGMVEAVTGSGKTYLGLGAWKHASSEFRPVNCLVVVPSIPLMNQWHERLREAFPSTRVGRIGGGHRDDFSRTPICVAVINSAAQRVRELFKHCNRGRVKSFLIADECHRYVEAPVFSEIRRYGFDYVLAISATLDDHKVAGYGKTVYSYTFRDAVRDGLIPEFDIVNSSVRLSPEEREQYEDLSERIRDQIRHLKNLYPAELRGLRNGNLFRRLRHLMNPSGGDEDPDIRRLFGLLFLRTKISYTATRKMALAAKITSILLNQGRRKIIVFFERIQSAENLADDLAVETAEKMRTAVADQSSKWCEVLHSGLTQNQRRERLDDFRIRRPAALLTCRVLDEGIDIPEIDAAVLVASTQSQRQRIQRIGRALRQSENSKRPIIVTLYVPETRDSTVVEEDRQIFKYAAMIHDETETTCVDRIERLLEI